ncbi:MAG: hypothetical protein K9K65_18580, partial [Desulfarculaceae bacterium]|nr:hypothetical protein [Desulfarculaceae bacterium]
GDEPYSPPAQQNTLPAWGGAPMELEPEVRASLTQAWPRLEGRYAGWSRAKVARELSARPQVIQGILPQGLAPERREELSRALAKCLTQGLNLTQTLAKLGRAAQGEQS